jgi:hypothetical protein
LWLFQRSEPKGAFHVKTQVEIVHGHVTAMRGLRRRSTAIHRASGENNMKTKVLLGRPLFTFWFQLRLNWHLNMGWSFPDPRSLQGFSVVPCGWSGSLLVAWLEKADK